jgi:hypothetical protein
MSDPARIDIQLAHSSAAERRICARLRELLRRKDLAPWTWTTELTVDERSYPHSHPRLTLNTACGEDDELLLATFVHEQLHWFEESRAEARDRAIEATRTPFPEVPTQRPAGAGSENSTRLHLLVCQLEFEALCRLLGPDPARETIERLSRHHYGWVYRTVLTQGGVLRRLLKEHDLWPEVLSKGEASAAAGPGTAKE